MTKATGKTPREALLNATLIGFQADADTARKAAATTSGKGPTETNVVQTDAATGKTARS